MFYYVLLYINMILRLKEKFNLADLFEFHTNYGFSEVLRMFF